jgi:hypothetical protein|tara:strand:+ start:565 stop:876 length:312 start_codon:yes stop_codon:yes gene_type:complete
MEFREIVKDAFKVNWIWDVGFRQSDVENGILKTGSIEEVNEKYSDKSIIEMAQFYFDVTEDELEGLPSTDEFYLPNKRDLKELTNFLKKYDPEYLNLGETNGN